ncbi:molybdopterin-dependent oxidoreductase [Larsenimonas rhizosphaerae]|uniref:molybdopterin-dependent oxidoreductase n=1 Tax=Larsenimonas rhizosphaerae TaxID=2944682 RepID=UPI002033E706|nr:molybdopterin-dependent oxidoreductase [Larsenimonas rhizosphaerae]MCM2131911.1 molybdopterin-dependent oxidoreductase [Larsenimonas rhizosphaerae]
MLSIGLAASQTIQARDVSIGIVSQEAQASPVVLEYDQLAALPQHVIITHTPWHDHAVRFEGPLVRDVLTLAAHPGADITLTGLNDYHARMPASDYMNHDVILAMSADGQPLRVRDFGPLFAIYPFDETPGLMDALTRARCVWQINRILVH